jgi:pSer/pThr/pTyr-binding forkhead associated (FHA) protein
MSSTGIVNHRDRGHATWTAPALDLGEYLAVEDGTQIVLVPIPAGVLHIGRSPAAGLTLDDGTVSRRHAVIVCDGAGESSTTARSTGSSSVASG